MIFHRGWIVRLTNSLIGFFIVTSSSVAAATGYVITRAGVTNGDFGTDTTQKLYSLTVTGGVQSDRLDASVSVPFLRYESQGNIENGVGDILIRGGAELIQPSRTDDISLSASVAAKLPTADESKGLGSGEADYGAFISVGKSLTTLKMSLYGGYVVIGDPAGMDYKNQTSFGVGIFRRFELTGFFSSLDWRSHITDATDDALELNFGTLHWLNSHDMIGASGLIGLSDGSPDFGVYFDWIRLF